MTISLTSYPSGVGRSQAAAAVRATSRKVFQFHGHRFQVMRKVRNQITVLKVSPAVEEGEEEEST